MSAACADLRTWFDQACEDIARMHDELQRMLLAHPQPAPVAEMREPTPEECKRIAREYYGDIPINAPEIAGSVMFDAVRAVITQCIRMTLVEGGKTVRIGYTFEGEGDKKKKVRVARPSGKKI